MSRKKKINTIENIKVNNNNNNNKDIPKSKRRYNKKNKIDRIDLKDSKILRLLNKQGCLQNFNIVKCEKGECPFCDIVVIEGDDKERISIICRHPVIQKIKYKGILLKIEKGKLFPNDCPYQNYRKGIFE